jgi:hypothetical protein
MARIGFGTGELFDLSGQSGLLGEQSRILLPLGGRKSRGDPTRAVNRSADADQTSGLDMLDQGFDAPGLRQQSGQEARGRGETARGLATRTLDRDDVAKRVDRLGQRGDGELSILRGAALPIPELEKLSFQRHQSSAQRRRRNDVRQPAPCRTERACKRRSIATYQEGLPPDDGQVGQLLRPEAVRKQRCRRFSVRKRAIQVFVARPHLELDRQRCGMFRKRQGAFGIARRAGVERFACRLDGTI